MDRGVYIVNVSVGLLQRKVDERALVVKSGVEDKITEYRCSVQIMTISV